MHYHCTEYEYPVPIMSRNFIPAVLAIGMGVWTGYYTFQPALREKNTEKDSPQGNQNAVQQQVPPTQNNETRPSAAVNDPKAPGK